MVTNVAPAKLYKVRKNLPHLELVIVLIAGIVESDVLWLHGDRRSSLGGLGTFSLAYESSSGRFSPSDKMFYNFPMRYFEELKEE